MNKYTKSIIALSVLSILWGCQTETPVVNEPIVVVEEPIIEEPEVVEEEPEIVEEPEEEIVEEPAEINPRDMKAKYNLDFDVPIYTEEEVETAKENLKAKADDYNNFDPNVGFKDEDYNYIGPNFYVANQDTLYELYNCTKDFDFALRRKETLEDSVYYDETHDMFIRVNYSKIILITKDFEFHKDNSSKVFETGSIMNGFLIVGPGAYTHIGAEIFSAPFLYEEYMNIKDYIIENNNIEELIKYGFKISEKDLTVTTMTNQN